MKKFLVSDLSQLKIAVQSIVKDHGAPRVFLLSGPLGAGKTKFVEMLVQELGGQEVSSPTFTFHQEYKTSAGRVHHFDLYRVESEDELTTTGFWDVLQQKRGFVCVEWPDRAGDAFPGWNVTKIDLKFTADNQRELCCTDL